MCHATSVSDLQIKAHTTTIESVESIASSAGRDPGADNSDLEYGDDEVECDGKEAIDEGDPETKIWPFLVVLTLCLGGQVMS